MEKGFRIQDSGFRRKAFRVHRSAFIVAFLLSAFSLQPSAFSQEAPKADAPALTADNPKSKIQNLKSTEPVALDAEFIELYGDYALIRQEIERIETATGQVTIPQSLRDLSTRGQAKEKKMQVWIKAHNVGAGWILNWQDKRFEAPEKQTAVGSRESGVGSQKSEGKPQAKAEVRSQK